MLFSTIQWLQRNWQQAAAMRAWRQLQEQKMCCRYILNEQLAMTCDEQCEMRMELMDNMSLDGMSCLVCGFINTSHHESQILYGIQPECPSVGRATMCRMPCDQELRDHFRVSSCKLTSQQITPPVTAGLTGRKYNSSGTPGGQTAPALGRILCMFHCLRTESRSRCRSAIKQKRTQSVCRTFPG